MNPRSVVAFVLVSAILCGCGKKEEEAPPPAPVAETPAATPDAPAAAVAEEKAPATPQKNWDEYVTKIVKIRSGVMTDEKRSEMLALQDELVAAAASDPKAREAYQNLSRIMTGR